MYKSVTVFCRQHRSRTPPNLGGSFFHWPTFENDLSVLCPFHHVLILALVLYSSSNMYISKREAIFAENFLATTSQ